MTKKSKKPNKPIIEISTKKVLEKLTSIVEETANKLNLLALETSFKKEGGHYFLRIFIYNYERPVNHDDCTCLTRELSSIIEELNLIDVPYSLEVSSPGINRKLKNPIEFDIFKGREVKITFKKSFAKENDINTLTGILLGLTENEQSVIIEIDNEEKTINLIDVKSIQLEDLTKN